MTVRDDQLLYGLFFAALSDHLLGQRDPDADLSRGQIAEFDQGPERLVQVAVTRHALGVRQEIGPGVREEALFCADLPDQQIRPMTLWDVSNDLLADGDGVVRQVCFAIELYGLVVMLDRLIESADADVEIPYAVVEADVHLLIAGEFSERLFVLIEGFLPILVLLVLTRLLLERLDAHTVRSEVSVRPPRRAATCTATRRESIRAGPGSGSCNLPAESGSTRVSGTMPMTSVSTTLPPILATSAAIRSKTATGEVRIGSSRFIETCTRPEPARRRPSARSPSKPPPRSRMDAAMPRAASTVSPATKTFHARSTGRAPTHVTPAVGCAV